MAQPISIPPRWQIKSPDQPAGTVPASATTLLIQPGASFGDGSHPTTQLCLQAIAALAPRRHAGWRMLDFGCGSGILAIAGARLGAVVDAIEIDGAAIAEAQRNAQLNQVEPRIRFGCALDQIERRGAPASGAQHERASYHLIVANILRSVLLEHAAGLAGRLGNGGALVLSGLVATDVPAISARYAPLLGDQRPELFALDDWRALVWRHRQ